MRDIPDQFTEQEAQYRESSGHFGIVSKQGNFVPLIQYSKEWHKLIRRVDSNHFIGKYKGYGIHTALINLMIEKVGEQTELTIVKNNTGEKFISKLSDWKESGIPISWTGQQLCLPVKKMRVINQTKSTTEKVDWEKERLATIRIIQTRNEETKLKQQGLFQFLSTEMNQKSNFQSKS